MSEMFWESVQKARKEHFCDWCCNWIDVGDTYSRRAWVPRKGSFHIMREHVDPVCPPSIDEERMAELMREEEVALGVAIVFVAEVRQVVKVGVGGETLVETEHRFTPTLICEAEPSADFDEEIPF